MTNLNYQEVINATFKPSLDAHNNSEELKYALRLDSRAEAVKLSIGYSLGLKGNVSPVENSAGKEINGVTIFGKQTDEVNLWIALICTYGNSSNLLKK